MPWGSSSSPAAATIQQRLPGSHPTHAPPFLYPFPSRGAVYWLSDNSRVPSGRAFAQCRSRFLRCRRVGLWAGLGAACFSSPAQPVTSILCSKNDEGEVSYVEEVQKSSGDAAGTEGRDGKRAATGTFSSNKLMEQLKRYGVAGVLSYGLLNTFYYLITFLLVWFYFVPAPGKMGYAAAVERFLKVMVSVWAGSQVTKLLRAGGALALAPLVDKGLSWFTIKFKFESKGKAFAAIAGACFGLAFLLFLVLTMLSA